MCMYVYAYMYICYTYIRINIYDTYIVYYFHTSFQTIMQVAMYLSTLIMLLTYALAHH